MIICFSLIAGSYEFKHNTKYPSFLICMNCPHWKEEIKIWKTILIIKLKIMELSKSHICI